MTKSNRLEAFLEDYSNESTKGGYRAAMFSFIDCIYGQQRKGRITESEKITYGNLIDRYLTESRNYDSDMLKFANCLKDRPALSAKQVFRTVKEFLSYHDIEVSKKNQKKIKNAIMPKGGVATIEKPMDAEKVREIIQHLDLKGKALVLSLISSGMRIGETLQITEDDIDLNSKPVKVTIRREYTKTKRQRVTFISGEAAACLKQWLKVRDSYLQSAARRNNGLIGNGHSKSKQTDTNRIFPFSDNIAGQMLKNALVKSENYSKDRTTGRTQIHPHMFRKFFISQMSLIVSKEIPEMLSGHSGYLTDNYRRFTNEQLASEYLKAEHVLTIEIPADVREIQSELKTEMNSHAKSITTLYQENTDLRQRLTKLESVIMTMEKINEVG